MPPRRSSARVSHAAKPSAANGRKRKAEPEESEEEFHDEDTGDEGSDARLSLDSDHLDSDDDDDSDDAYGGDGKKRARRGAALNKRAKTSPTKTKTKSASSSSSPAKKPARATKRPRKRRSTGGGAKDQDDDDDEYDDVEAELSDGKEIVGRIVQAPKSGRVPPGQISQNTFDFLSQLKKPECNDREWFKLHEPVFRLAEQEWKDFVAELTDDLIDADSQLPPLPPKDVIHRIYRDVRFSNDKTPYKQNFSASFSRSGRKGIFAGYHVSIKPGGESLVAAGSWCPGKNELQSIRLHIQHDPSRLREALARPKFVELFGEPKPGKRRSIFGMEDELKKAPKGVDKEHEHIDLLKCRSFAVVHRFTDKEVLAPTFKETVASVVRAARPLVYCLNDYMTVGFDEDGDEDGDSSP